MKFGGALNTITKYSLVIGTGPDVTLSYSLSLSHNAFSEVLNNPGEE